MNVELPLPPIPQPPHDPTSWLLAAHTGWRAAQLAEVEKRCTDGALALARQPGSVRSLTEPSGSLGGLVPPAQVALAADGSVFLLDSTTAQLKRFDPCTCRFDVVPCFGGVGNEARQLQEPHGIAIGGGNLFVADAGNHRLTVIALHGFVLRGHWRPPATAALAHPWRPFAVAVDSCGRIYVTDSANAVLHRFSARGEWELFLAGITTPAHLAMDCADRVYVIGAEDDPGVRVFDAAGHELSLEKQVEAVQPRFAPLPFAVDANGWLRLGALCESLTATGVFDAQGNPVVNAPPPATPTYFTSGTFISQALDSELYRCQWHRVLLRGALPTGASVTVETYTAEARLSDDQIQGLSANAWDAGPTANAFAKGAWDCLVRSGAGRFLWLKLTLQSNGRVTPQLDSVELEFPRISLRRYLPAVFGAEATSADFTDRFLSLFDTTLRGFERELDTLARYFDPASAPAQRETPASLDFLSWLSSWIGVSLDRHWSETRRRRFVKEAGKLFGLRGTRAGLHQQLLLLLEMEPEQRCCPDDEPRTTCTPAPANCALPVKHPCAWTPPPLILEHYQVRRWLWVGQGRLGEQAALWGRAIVNRSQLDANAQTEVTQLVTKQDPLRDPFHLYAHKFSVFVPARVERSETSRKALENLLRTERPAQTQAQIVYVAPQFRIGVQSMLGYDTVIGRYPAGVTLGETPLGAGSVLTDATGATGVEAPSSLEIGKPLRIGTTTRL